MGSIPGGVPAGVPAGNPPDMSSRTEMFSRKVFVGGLPPDIDQGNTELCDSFRFYIVLFQMK